MNHQDDPFFSSPQDSADEHTVIRPVPGGRRADLRANQQAQAAAFTPGQVDTPAFKGGKLNPLESAASALLALVPSLYRSISHPNPEQLRQQLSQEIRSFEINAEKAGISRDSIHQARYALCTTIDEAIFNTPWGRQSGWGEQSLLAIFHKEVYGGDRFFQMLKAFGQNPSKYIDLLEVFYLCLALGFQGRYRVTEGGKDKLLQIREWLLSLIRKQRGIPEQALSPHWHGVTDRQNQLSRSLPIWLVALLSAALLVLLFAALLFSLSFLSDPAFRMVQQLQAPLVATPEPLKAQKPKPAALAESDNEFFTSSGNKITLKGKFSFPSGSATLTPAVLPPLQKVAESLETIPGQIMVTGHTDNIPMRNSLKFPSNIELSKARAEAVANVLRAYISDPDRIEVQGMADAKPIAPNDTAEGRLLNRRVEIDLLN